MLNELSIWLSSHGTLVALSTLMFFTLKGVAWLVVPALAWRWRVHRKTAASSDQSA